MIAMCRAVAPPSSVGSEPVENFRSLSARCGTSAPISIVALPIIEVPHSFINAALLKGCVKQDYWKSPKIVVELIHANQPNCS